jgi:TonB-dependent receptor
MSTQHRRHPAHTAASRNFSRNRFPHTLIALSIAALLSTQAQAQTQPQPQATPQPTAEQQQAVELDTVTVTGIRGSVYRAQDIKRSADTFVDSVTAEDIGALPDRSVTETLSRIPGVTIDRFLSAGDPEHPSAEGSGVQVRGMTQVRSELNGRDTFSANGGRSIGFQDVPSELMAGVDVYKNQKAEMIEGGLGGTVDLRTFKPLDFDGQRIAFSLSENYGNFAEQYKPSASALYSNRWDTELGEFGFLVDIAHSELATRTDGMFVRPFFETDNTDLNGDGTNEQLWLPRGADWRTLDFERERQGIYLALQWRPTDDVELHATVFQSRYDELWYEDAIFVGNDPTAVRIDTSQPYELDGGVFRSGRLVQEGDIPMGTDIRASNSKSKTTDFSLGLKWALSERTELTTDLQYVKAETRRLDSTVSLGVNVPYIDVNLTGGTPSIGIDEEFTGNPANYYWGFTMDHRDDNVADQLAWRADLKHSFDSGFFRAIKFGARLTDRSATSRDTGYDWQPVFQPWMAGWAVTGPTPGLDLNDEVNSSLAHLNTFDNFYRGDVNPPGSFFAPVLSTALGFPDSYLAIHGAAAPYYACCYGQITPRNVRDPQWTNLQNETTTAAYAMLDFAVDDLRLDGNVGVRAVRTENSASGYLIFPNVVYAPYLGAGETVPLTAKNSYTDVLPSLNVRWEPIDNVIVRFAASKAIARPAFSDMQVYQLLSADLKDGITIDPDNPRIPDPSELDLTGSSTDNPYLEPMKANQFDLSLEWYFSPDKGGMAWINFFHKDIKDYFRNQSRLVPYPGADGNMYDYLVTQTINTGEARIQGAEIGWNQFFDFLPAPFDGFGVSANYTYIDSSTKVPIETDAQPIDTDGSLFGDLPADGLSKNSYNVAAFYEKGPWQIRVAYNWRSEYLLGVGANGYNGTNNNLAGESVAWKLPVYSDEYGQLDASVFYSFNDHIKLGLEMNNLNNAEQRTIMDQNGAGKRTTSWYVNDTRYAATLRVNF